MKKALSLLLMLCMLVSAIAPTLVFAEATPSVTVNVGEVAVAFDESRLKLLADGNTASDATSFGDAGLVAFENKGFAHTDGVDAAVEATFEIVLDLGEVQTIGSISLDAYKDSNSMIALPTVDYYVSIDGENYYQINAGAVVTPASDAAECATTTIKADFFTRIAVNVQYIKAVVSFTNGWVFLSELSVGAANDAAFVIDDLGMEYPYGLHTVNYPGFGVFDSTDGEIDLAENDIHTGRILRNSQLIKAVYDENVDAYKIEYSNVNPWPNGNSGYLTLAEDEILVAISTGGTVTSDAFSGAKWISRGLGEGDWIVLGDETLKMLPANAILSGEDLPDEPQQPDVPADLCTHQNTKVETVAPTCGIAGSETVICLDCNTILEHSFIAPTGEHCPNEISGIGENCGYVFHEYTCGRCYSNYAQLVYNDHVYDENGICYICDADQACEHLNTIVYTDDATCSQYGYTRTVCTDCGDDIASEYFAPLGHYQIDGICTACNKGYGCTEQFQYLISDGMVTILGYIGGDADQVTVPESIEGCPVKIIGEDAFKTDPDFPVNLNSILLPLGITTIEDEAFYGLRDLTNVNIPNTVSYVGNYAFYACSSMRNITIPNSVTKMGLYVFSGCTNLTDIYCEAADQPSGWSNAWKEFCNASVHWNSGQNAETPAEPKNLAAGKEVANAKINGMNTNYCANLTDGVIADTISTDYGGWFGYWYNPNASPDVLAEKSNTLDGGLAIPTIDLGKKYDLASVRMHIVDQADWGISAPQYATVQISDDGVTFADVTTVTEFNTGVTWVEFDLSGYSAQYVRIAIQLDSSWFFLDEVEIYGYDYIDPSVCTHETTTVKHITPTCGYSGGDFTVCLNCKTVLDSTIIPATGKHYNNDPPAVDGEACGYEMSQHVCAECCAVYAYSTIYGHSFNGGETCYLCGIQRCDHLTTEIETLDATCLHYGYIRTKCMDCNDILACTITSPLGHYLADGNTCTNCNAYCGVTSQLRYTILDGEVTIVQLIDQYAESVVIPSEIEGCPVTRIAQNAFRNDSYDALHELVIPDTVTTIEEYAFYERTLLDSLTIPASVTTIGAYAFSDGNARIDICCEAESMPDGWDAQWLFYRSATVWFGGVKTKWTAQNEDMEYLVDNGEVTITDYVGDGGNVVIPSEIEGYPVVAIGASAFSSSNALLSVVIPNSVISIGNNAFRYCSELTEITIPTSVENMGWYVFYDCSKLQNIYCEAVEQPAGWVIDWDNYCDATVWFDGVKTKWIAQNEDMEYLVDNGEVTITDYVGDGGNVVIPSEIEGYPVVAIGKSAFEDGTTILSVVIPNSVISIGNNAFRYCSELTEITIPASVENMGWFVFYNCSKLQNIYCEAVKQPAGWVIDWDYNCGATVYWGYVPEPEILYGDANGDGEINGKDVTRLLNYLASYDVTTGMYDGEMFEGADCNGDGVIDGRDAVRLMRYLANLDPVTGESSVILGK